jgi:diguanylate cyclase (GGDEF)-like protein/PAS domain S-box-containing protein
LGVADRSATLRPNNPNKQAKSTRALPLHLLVWLGIGLSSLGLLGSAGWAVWQAYQRSTEAAMASTQNFVRVLKQHTERTIESVDMLLKIVARELGPDSADALKRSQTLEGLAYLTQDVPHVLSLRLLDGKSSDPLFEFVRTRSVGAEADRDALEAHASAKYLGLYVGRPLRDPASGAWVVGISRRVTGREGIPGQVVIAHLSLDYLQQFYDKVRLGQQGSITLVRRDGTVLARRPFDAANVGRNITASPLFREQLPRANMGTYEAVAVNDGIARIFSYEALAEVPLVVTVGLSKSEILSAWLNDATRDASLAGGATLILIVVGSFLTREVRRRDHAEAALRNSEERLRLALQAGRMLAWELDPATGFVTRSENAPDVIGLTSGQISDYFAHVHPDDRDKVMAAAKASYKGQMSTVEFRFIRPDGEVIWLEVRAVELIGRGGAKRVVGTTFDITSRKSIEETVWRAANHDSLTGLANRSLFQSQLDAAFCASDGQFGSSVSLLLIDLDDFKGINDTLGHEAGDVFLQEFARRLQALATAGETVARLGGDEFAMIVRDQPLADLLERAQGMLVELDRPFPFKDRLLTSRASIGIASHPEHHHDPAELMKGADMALYAAKSGGGHRVAVYTPDMRAEIERRVLVVTEARAALANAQLLPFYQPKICLVSNEVVGFEALARWKHPERGLLTPAAFASAFEDHHVARDIGRAMLNQIMTDLRAWLARGLSCGSIAINLAPAEFNDPTLAEQTLELLRHGGVAPEHLEIEVTESVLLGRRADQVGAVLERFHAAGVTIALDDFGTGYASLSHLKQFPVDLIKIDRSFVRDLERDPEDAAIVAAVIGLGKSLNMEVVAEGVETLGQVRFLQQHQCNHAQGYFFAKPLPASRVPWFLSEGHAVVTALLQDVPSTKRAVRA